MTTQGSLSRKKKKFRFTQDTVFDIVVAAALLLIIVIMAYPIYFVFVASFSDPAYVNNGSMLLWPKGFTLLGYQKVFEDARIWIGYGNTLIYTAGGTALGTLVTMMAGYALSRKDLPFRNTLMGYFVFTMYFGGGLIPTYLVIRNLHMLNTMWALVLPGCLSVYNMIVARTFFKSNISEELYEAAEIDGCTQGQFFFRIALPLSAAITAILVLYYGVGHWNSYFSALVYISDSEKYPLQLVLRNILITNETALAQTATTEAARAALREKQQLIDVMKYYLIIISSIPVLLLYPFIQKYFVKGVMIGSLKG